MESSGLVNSAFAVFAKDLRLELRTKYALNTIMMFGVTTLAVVSFSLGQSGLPERLLAAIHKCDGQVCNADQTRGEDDV